jgi:hypothetical protein
MKQNLPEPWDTAKSVLRRKFITTSLTIKKLERSQNSYPIMYLKLLEKQKKPRQ